MEFRVLVQKSYCGVHEPRWYWEVDRLRLTYTGAEYTIVDSGETLTSEEACVKVGEVLAGKVGQRGPSGEED